MAGILERIETGRIVAILRGIPAEAVERTAEALLAGGVSCMEITYVQGNEAKSRETLEGIGLLRKRFGAALAVGAGTVLSAEQARAAADAGAEYLISPNTDEEVIRETKRLGLLSMPGAFTPTEAVRAAQAGADIIKLFPAGILGAEYVKALKGPLGHLRFAAVGGVDERNMRAFVEAGVRLFGIGSNLVDAKLAASGDWAEIEARARAFVRAAAD